MKPLRRTVLFAASMILLLCMGCDFTASIDRMKFDPVRTDDVSLEGIENPDKLDTAGYLYYKGCFYTNNLSMTEEAAGMPMEDLIEQEIGQATGKLAGWSAQADDFATMACNFKGTVYTVKGYDESFRLIIHDPESVDMPWKVMENYDDIELRCGLDLFETRLHLVSRIKSAEAEGHDGKRRKVSVVKASQLLRAACAAQIEPVTWQDQFRRSRYGKTGWLNLEMKDGTRLQLYLEEGGYVPYAPLSNFGVAIPGSAFDRVFRFVSDVKHYD